jgi:hypothetical protein
LIPVNASQDKKHLALGLVGLSSQIPAEALDIELCHLLVHGSIPPSRFSLEIAYSQNRGIPRRIWSGFN